MVEPSPQTSGGASATNANRLMLRVVVLLLWGLAAAAVYEIRFYLRIPVDVLSFAESPFVTDLINLRHGATVYGPPEDNSTYPYSPGTQMLVYVIGRALGVSDSIPALRSIQFTFVVAAALVAAATVAQLVRRVVPAANRITAWTWFLLAAPLLFLVSVDPRFNLYTHSLHNDGLALLVSACAFWLVVRHATQPSTVVLALMALVPAVGFMVKQSQLIWLPLFTLYLIACDPRRWRRALGFAGAAAALVVTTVAVSHAVWGEHYLWWVFSALGNKNISLLRSALHLAQAGGYLAMGVVALWVLVLDARDRTALILWTLWVLLLSAEAYTSGAAWVTNHLGPGVLLGSVLFLAAMARLWHTADATPAAARLKPALVAGLLLCMPGALGLLREPADHVPPDLDRYIRAIDAEFTGAPPETVLLDNGTWPYLRAGVVMKDRSSPVALHVGLNQPTISHEYLRCTIARLEAGHYAKILAHALDTAESPYDFQFRGSGIREAIASSYREVRRIPAVTGVQAWWPKGLLLEIVVLERREPPKPLSGDCA